MVSQQNALREQCRHPSGEVAEITRDDIEVPVHTLFARMVAAYPDKPAIVDLAGTMSYAELDFASNRIARSLQRHGGRLDQPIAILMESGRQMLAAAYGATKAGMCHVTLPPETPEERLLFMMQDLEHPLLLTDASNREMASRLVSRVDRLLLVEDALQNSPADPLHVAIGPDTRYFIRFTSGSTGRPKGVVSAHRDFLHFSRNTSSALQLCSLDRQVAFGNNYSPAIRATLAGATFFEFDLRHSGMAAVLERMNKQSLTIVGCPLTTFRQLVRGAAGRFTFPNVRVVLLFGEAPTPSDIIGASGLFSPKCVFSNQYGTTESYIATAYYSSVESASQLRSLPAGYEFEGMEVLLLDRVGQPVGDGETGEIVVRSRYLTQGYWNRPQLTCERFRLDPEDRNCRIYFTGDLGRKDSDGCLHYLGRKDQQVKIRGHRIEIPEVEAELLALDGVRMAAVDARPGPNGDLRLVAYVVPARDKLIVSELRQALTQRLPLAMVPAAFVFLPELPLTVSQKVDRQALPDPGRERPTLAVAYTAPRTPIETEVARIWADVLGMEEVGIDDNFLELGGDSLLASQVVTRVIDTLSIDLPLSTLFAAPTVADMALALTVVLVADSDSNQFEALH